MTRAYSKKWGVIFDMDGVLIDSYNAHFLSWKRALNKYGLSITEYQFSSTFGQTNKDILSKLFPQLDPREYAVIEEEKEKIFREIIKDDFPEMDGASELIDAIYNMGGLIGIGSSAPLENIKTVLELLPTGNYFRVIISGNDISYGKPDPEIFLKVAEKLGLYPNKCIVIEDSPSGVKAGKLAGCTVIGLVGTVSKEELKDADVVIYSLRDLSPKLLRNILKC